MTEVLTKRKLLLKRQSFLITMIEEAQKALADLVSGDITSYNFGTWSVSRSRPDLGKLQEYISQAMVELDSINNILTGRSPRKVSTCVYQNPQGVRWWDYL